MYLVNLVKDRIPIYMLCSSMYKIIANILHQIVLEYSFMKINYIISIYD